MANILVIDDDTSLLKMISIMLKRAGHTTLVADNGADGVRLAMQELPDLVVVDVMMPGMSGYEVCETLRKDLTTKKTPLLMLTALSQAEHRGRAEDAGADGFITKPVTRDDLIKHVEELLRTGARNFPDFTDKLHPVPPTPAAAAASPAPDHPPVTEAMKPPTPAPAPAAAAANAGIPPGPTNSVTSTGSYPAIMTHLPLVAVIGLAAGSGVTTLAVNMALALKQFGRTCVMDLSHRGGMVAPYMRAEPRGTWLNLLTFKPGSDKRLIAAALTMGHPSGVALVAAPAGPVNERLKGSALYNTYTVLSEGFSRVVVDLPVELDATSIATLNFADHVLIVVGNDPANLENIQDSLLAIEALRLPGQTHVVLNHTLPQGVSYEQVMQAMNQPLASDIPYDPAQASALASGQPLVMSQPGSLFTRTILHLARQM
jgi:CheY-like chemotaxis protein